MRPFSRFCRAVSGGLAQAVALGLCLAAGALSAGAQQPQSKAPDEPTFDATRLRQPVELGGTWLVHGGDDPAYAEPQFDDAGWTRLDISKSIHKLFPGGNPGVIWYRLRIKVAPDDTDLGLWESNVSHAFVVYSNGVELMKAGKFAPYVAYDTSAPLIAKFPAKQIATGSVLLVVRVHVAAQEWKDSLPGLAPENLRLGPYHELVQQQLVRNVHYQGQIYVEILLYALLGAAGLILYYAEREHKEYLWLSLYALTSALPQLYYALALIYVHPLETIGLQFLLFSVRSGLCFRCTLPSYGREWGHC